MNKLKFYLLQPASAPLASTLLILFVIACSCPRDNRNGGRLVGINSTDPESSNRKNGNTNSRRNANRINDESKPSDNSSSSYFVGTWAVTKSNIYLDSSPPLTVNSNKTYSWQEVVSGETFTGNWRMENGALILEKAYKGADWRVRVAPPKKDTSNDRIVIQGIGEGMGFYEYIGTRR